MITKLVRCREFYLRTEGSQGELSIHSPEAAVLFYLYFIGNCELSIDPPEATCNTFFLIMHHRDSLTWRKFDLEIKGQGCGRFGWNFPASIRLLSSRHVHRWNLLLQAFDANRVHTHRGPQIHTSTHVAACWQYRFPIRWKLVKRSLAVSKWLSYSPLFYFAILSAMLKFSIQMLFEI